jgi:membrane associated rhomboid family serine protease
MADENKPQADQGDGGAPQRQPMFNLEPAVAAIAGLFLAIQAADALVLNDWGRAQLIAWLAFIPYRLVDAAAIPGGLVPMLWTPLTHAFLHAGWEHVILNSVWFVIFATPMTQRYGTTRMVLVFVLGAVVGAAAFAATTLPDLQVLVGASGGVAALTGAAIRFMFQPIQIGVNAETGERIVLGRRLATIREVFAQPTARIFTIVWLGLNAAVPLLPVFMGGMELQVAWQAHLGGFLLGFFLVPLLERRTR